MNQVSKTLAAALILAALLPAVAVAEPSPAVGSRLSAAQAAGLATHEKYVVAKQTYTVLAPDKAQTSAAGSTRAPSTLVVSEQGLVGRSQHEVIVSEASFGDVSLAVRHLRQAPASTRDVAHLGMTVLTFATFAEAVAAHEALAAQLKQARVTLPIQFTTQVPQ